MDEGEKYKKYRGLIFLAMKNLRIYSKTEDERQDYIDAGTDGLLKAIRNYDHRSNVKESTYVYRCIYNQLKSEITKHNRIKRITKVLSYNTLLEDEEIIDLIPSDYDLEEEVSRDIRNEQVLKVINTLDFKGQYIIKSRFGIDGYKEKTPSQLAKELQISKSALYEMYHARIRRIYWRLRDIYYDN